MNKPLVFTLTLILLTSMVGKADSPNVPVIRPMPQSIHVIDNIVCKQEALGFPPGTDLTFYDTSIVRVQYPNGHHAEVRARLSADGKWFMFSPGWDFHTLFVSPVSGKAFARPLGLPRYPYSLGGYSLGNSIWMPDNKRWVMVAATYKTLFAIVQSITDPTYKRLVPLGRPPGTSVWGGLDCEILGAVDSTHLLALAPHVKPGQALFFTFSISGPSDVRNYEVRLPSGKNSLAAAYSPSRDRLVFFVGLEGNLTDGKTFSMQSFDILISRRDGSAPQVVGSFADPPANGKPFPGAHSDDEPEELIWRTDGGLQFLTHGASWMIPKSALRFSNDLR